MHTLLVVAHPRPSSLTAQVADRARSRLEAAGSTVDLLDLHTEGFDPRMTFEDEPDIDDPGKVYSAEVRAHMRRLEAADEIVIIFPVWWYGLPALLKGWIDRVWNHGFAYGPRTFTSQLAGKRVLWLGLAGGTERAFTRSGVHGLLEQQLTAGISRYSGIEAATSHVVYDTIDNGAAALETADAILADFVAAEATQVAA
ncbi:NAD(P)H oxidoreductase YRKL [Streptomyces gancidicus BKS 13-15]|uniref:NAD(P)H oxidoreductase YRKL n=1 Tax=Streptomyces gancidicus BKS 13-15 TaxID=1284664 RepID=M3C2G4_STREZ|nr:NAD(P)H oxidoreductase [Streptomyces gancidicus]EMF30504.1 NAD(P)H oxidoreductase YRKL [Streptomyces gancidicus BKS 13-15]